MQPRSALLSMQYLCPLSVTPPRTRMTPDPSIERTTREVLEKHTILLYRLQSQLAILVIAHRLRSIGVLEEQPRQMQLT